MQLIKAFLVDDSAVVLGVIGRLLETRYGIQVVGTARNGREALDGILRAKPDVVVLDVEMPVLDGLGMLERLMRENPLPVIMLSTHTRAGTKATMDALALGALDFVQKPDKPSRLGEMMAELVEKIRLAAGAHAVGSPEASNPVHTIRRGTKRAKAVIIGCSTGGPGALRVILPALPQGLPVPVAVVQHMPVGFTAALAEHLDLQCAVEVKHAENGDILRPGLVLVAPSGLEFSLRTDGEDVKVRLRSSSVPLPPGNFRPSVNATMKDFARVYGAGTLGVLLTGMGRDGVEGMIAVKRSGGSTIAQDQATSVVYGMPKGAVEAGAVDHLLPLPEIAAQISALV